MGRNLLDEVPAHVIIEYKECGEASVKTLRRMTREITGKDLVLVSVIGWFHQDDTCIEIQGGPGKKEAAIHEICHWIVAEDWQRPHPSNLGYGSSSDGYLGKDPRCTPAFREHQERLTCHLQRMLYQFAGLTAPTSPSCTGSRITATLCREDVERILGRAGEVGWDRLIELTRARS